MPFGCTNAAMSPSYANCTVPFLMYAVSRGVGGEDHLGDTTERGLERRVRLAEPSIDVTPDRRSRHLASSPSSSSSLREHLHQEPVVERPVGSLLVGAHDPDPTEADLLVGADRGRVVGRRVDREPVVTALLDQVPREDPHRLAPQSLAVPRRRQVQVDAGAAVHRIIHLAELHGADHLAVGLDHERVLVGDELVHLSVLEDTPSPLDLRLAADRGEARRVGSGGVPEDETRAGELHRATA